MYFPFSTTLGWWIEKGLRTGEVPGLEGDHLIGVGLGVLGFAIRLVLLGGR